MDAMCAQLNDEITVALQLAGEGDVAHRGVLANIVAVSRRSDATPTTCTVSAPVQRDPQSGALYLGPMTSSLSMPPELRSLLASAIEDGWRTGRGVDVLDETGCRLMLGALREHPSGVARWLAHYCRRER